VARREGWAVTWYAPGRKRPIAYSTQATSNLIGWLADNGFTFNRAREEILYDTEAYAVLDTYIERGYGDTPMREIGIRK
jgi:hypothetical protein